MPVIRTTGNGTIAMGGAGAPIATDPVAGVGNGTGDDGGGETGGRGGGDGADGAVGAEETVTDLDVVLILPLSSCTFSVTAWGTRRVERVHHRVSGHLELTVAVRDQGK